MTNKTYNFLLKRNLSVQEQGVYFLHEQGEFTKVGMTSAGDGDEFISGFHEGFQP